MKYCVSSQHDNSVLDKVDEIRIPPIHYRRVQELCEKYPDKTIIIQIPSLEDIKFTVDELAKVKGNTHVVCELEFLNKHFIERLKAAEIGFYYAYPVATYYEMQGLINMGAEYVSIAPPLSFEMHLLEKVKCKLRMNPAVVYKGAVPGINPLHGQWVRPEDVEYYENVYVFDFFEDDLRREAYMLGLYQKGEYTGNLNLLFPQLDDYGKVYNALIPGIGQRRAVCGQRCEKLHDCQFCERMVRLPHLQHKVEQKMQELDKVHAEFEKARAAHKAQEDATSDEN